MDRTKYDKCDALIRQVDGISDSAKVLLDSMDAYNRDTNGRAEFVIYVGGESTKTILTDSEANKVAAIILETYKENITKARKDLDDTLSGLYSDLDYDAEFSLSNK